MRHKTLLLGVDGGGTWCRARLADGRGCLLGEGTSGPANLRLGLDISLSAVRDCTAQCLKQAHLSGYEDRLIACLALAGASEPSLLEEARALPHPFHHVIFTTDARAACVGAHAGQDGGVVIVGTGSVGWAMIGEIEHRVGGWGLPLSDEGSGAWLGCQALRRVLWARDGLTGWTGFLKAIFERFESDPHTLVRWTDSAQPRDYAELAPILFNWAAHKDCEACTLAGQAAQGIERLVLRLAALGAPRIALMGGLSDKVEPFLSAPTKAMLVAPEGDALSGALRLAERAAARLPACLEK